MPPRSMQDRLTLLEHRVSQLESTTIPALREEMRAGFEDMRARFAALEQRMEQRMEQGFDETRRHARVLYEDLVTRIATIGEAGPAPSRRARRKP
jgi:predicted phage gp36 major capsid-like protein